MIRVHFEGLSFVRGCRIILMLAARSCQIVVMYSRLLSNRKCFFTLALLNWLFLELIENLGDLIAGIWFGRWD